MNDIIERLHKILAHIAAMEPTFSEYDNGPDQWICPLCDECLRAVYSPPGHLNKKTMVDIAHDAACPWLLTQQLGGMGIDGFLSASVDSLVDNEFLRARYTAALGNLTAQAGKALEEWALPEVEGEWKTDIENMVRFLEVLVFDAERARRAGAASKAFDLWRIINMGISPLFGSTPVYDPGRDYEAEILYLMRRLDEQARALEIIMRRRGDAMGYLRAMRDALRALGSNDPFRHGDAIQAQADQEATDAVADLEGIEPDALRVMKACYADAWSTAYQRGVTEVRQGSVPSAPQAGQHNVSNVD